ncbi:titin isoform X2 [Drosophila guanche]|uniref:titin isoform X2 n=1 Tax=Drosophila guanche TaxID=7266 RepID=UPI001472078D|nr:titin isoform X2 [Drosophila guanche]
MAASSATAAEATTIPTEAITEECKDEDALSTTLHSCANDPDFAVICAFLQKFAKDLGLILPNFKHLQEWLTNNDEVPELKDLHIKLLRKTRKTVHEKNWESALSKFCFGYSLQDAWEIERFGYKNSSLKVKLRIFRELLESQFERNVKFRAHILTQNSNTLRSEPIGRDRLGHAYWLTQDDDCNLRIYQEHLDEEIWQVVATNRDEFVNLIARLRGNEVVLPSKDIGEADEDTSSSNSCPAKPPPPEEKEEEDEGDEDEAEDEDEQQPEPQIREEPAKVVPNLKIKLRSPDQDEQKAKRVKPLFITQTKLGGSCSPAPAKKRSIEEVDSSPTESVEEQQKKHRPTLLDIKRIKKPSRYESTKDENDAESGEEEEEDDDDSELDEAEEEEGSGDDDDEEDDDDIDSAAADIEEDDGEADDEVGEAIEEPTMTVSGQGSGSDCDAADGNFLSNFDQETNDNELELSEAIEEAVIHVFGTGNGAECLVGNGKNEAAAEEAAAAAPTHSEPKATFFFGEPGCLKLSPIKQTPKQEAKRSIFDSLNEEKTNGESGTREGTPPRNGSDLKEEPQSHKQDAATKTGNETKEISPEAGQNKALQATSTEQPEYQIKVIETNEKISQPIEENDTKIKDDIKEGKSNNIQEKEFENHSKSESNLEKEAAACCEGSVTAAKSPKVSSKATEIKVEQKETLAEAVVNDNRPVPAENEASNIVKALKTDKESTKRSPENAKSVPEKDGSSSELPKSSSETITSGLETVKSGPETVIISSEAFKSRSDSIRSNSELFKNCPIAISIEKEQIKAIQIQTVPMKGEKPVEKDCDTANTDLKKFVEDSDKISDDSKDKPINEKKPAATTATNMIKTDTEKLLKAKESSPQPVQALVVDTLPFKSSKSFPNDNNSTMPPKEQPKIVIEAVTVPNEQTKIIAEAAVLPKEQSTIVGEAVILPKEQPKAAAAAEVLPKEQSKAITEAVILPNEKTKPVAVPLTTEKKFETSNNGSQIKEKPLETVQNDLPSTSKAVIPKDNGEKQENEAKSPPAKAPAVESVHKFDVPMNINASASEYPKPASILPNRKRRLNDFVAAPARQSTSESEVDAQQHEEEIDEALDDLDVGGKRIKMRPKTSNVEARRKVEAQKTHVEETTSSSGEEDPRSRRKIIAPKRHLEKAPVTKQKPTLAEIIEKKLKKTPEKLPDFMTEKLPDKEPEKMPEQPTEPTPNVSLPPPPPREATPPAPSFCHPKKSPITKPLKKNLLTQLRQEESDEEAVPRKRTNSETVVPTPVPAAPPAVLEERQRKRRSSEDAKDSKESSSNEAPPAVSEKLKRNNEQDIVEEEDPAVVSLTKERAELSAPTKEQFPSPALSINENIVPESSIKLKDPSPPPAMERLLMLPPTIEKSPAAKGKSIPIKDRSPPAKDKSPAGISIIERSPAALSFNEKSPATNPIKEKDALPSPSKHMASSQPEAKEKTASPSISKEKAPPPKDLSPSPVKEKIPAAIPTTEKNPVAPPAKDESPVPPAVIEKTSTLKTPLAVPLKEQPPMAPPAKEKSPVAPSTMVMAPLLLPPVKQRSLSPAHGKEKTPVEVKEKSPVPVQVKEKTPSPLQVKEKASAPAQRLPVKESTPPLPSKDTSSPPEGSARRSGRRGGAAVVYSELPQPKRTRGGPKEKLMPEAKAEVKHETSEEEEEEEEDEKDTGEPPAKVATKLKAQIKIETAAKNEETQQKKPLKEDEPLTKKPLKEEENPQKKPLKEEEPLQPKQPSKEEPLAELEEPLDEESISEVTAAKEEQPAKPVGRGRGPRKKREVDTTNIIECVDSETPVRQSRRIAQQKIKEEAERRKQEEVALRSMKQELKKKKKAQKEQDPTVPEPTRSEEEEEAESSEASEAEEAKKKKKKLPGKDGWSSDSDQQADSEEEEEEPPHYDTDPGSPLFRSDHEFSPESELEDESQVVPMKRARTVRKENEEDYDADEACNECGKSDHPEWILLCDTPNCNKGYHCSCLSPVLFYIPEGDWHCPPCQQEHLIVALEQQLQRFDQMVAHKQQEKRLAEVAERERQELEAVKLAEDREASKAERHEDDDDDDDDRDEVASKQSKADKPKRRRGDGRSNRKAAKRGTRRRRGGDSDSSSGGAGGKSQSGGSASGSGSSSNSSSFSDSDDEPIYKLRKRRQINVSYRLNEYDDLINSALKKEMDEVAGAGNLGRGKDISTIIEADKEKARRDDVHVDEEQPEERPPSVVNEEKPTKLSSSSDDEDEVPLKRSKTKQPPAKKKPRKLTTLDVSSEEDHGSDEDFKTSSYSEEDTSQSASDDSDSSLEVYRRPGRGKKQRKAARRAARERRKDRKFVVEESDESEEEQKKPKSKKKKKEDSDYTETETDDDEDAGSELTENMDSADLCDDTTSESEDGAWHPSKKKKTNNKKCSSAAGIARKSPKLKKPAQPAKKPKRLEYSDDDISESEPEEEDEDDDEGAPTSGKGSGKQPRSQPLKPSASTAQTGKGKGKSKKKKPPSSEEDEGAASDERTRTRGRRYAYIEDFDDDSSDGGIKPGVHRPDTPPEERQKFIQKQEEIKRMLAEKNAEGAKLAATPRLTPIKGTAPGQVPTAGGAQEKRTPSKGPAGGDSLSTVPLSVIRQAKVLDIDYLQRKGETIGDLEDKDESEELDDSEMMLDDADLPEDMEDAIARMVEEEEQFSAAAARELPGPEEVLRTTPAKAKASKVSAPVDTPPMPPAPHAAAAPPSSGLQEPHRKRLPMPTMHPPLLRHQFPGPGQHGPPASLLPPPHGMHPMLQRQLSQSVPAMQLLQNALSAPLGQPLGRGNYPQPPPTAQHLPLVMSMPSAAAHLMHQASVATQQAAGRAPEPQAARPPPPPVDSKPRGRRKKVTPLRDQLQKQQTAAAVTAASTTPGTPAPPVDKIKGVPAQLFKPHEDAPPRSTAAASSQASVITRMPTHLSAHPHARGPPAGMYPSSAEFARFYAQPLPPPSSAPGSRSPSSGVGPAASPGPPRHLLRPQMPPGLPPPHSALRPTYGPPPPLRGAPPPTSTASSGGASPNTRPPYMHGAEHHGGPPLGSVYGTGPPPARHASPHLNPYSRGPPIYGNPNYQPRVGPPGPPPGNMRPGAVDYVAGARGYPPYGYYPPPPPLTTPPAHAAPSSVIVSAPPPVTPTNHSVSALTRGKSPAPVAAAPPAEVMAHKAPPQQQQQQPPPPSVITSKKLTTLEAYPVGSPAVIAEEDSGSAHDTSGPPPVATGPAVGEFSGLVSYFSSQQDDYDT